MKKYQTTFLIKPEKQPSSLLEVMENIFYKNKLLAEKAISFLLEVKTANEKNEPYPTSNWRQFCTKTFQTKNKKELDRATAKYYGIINRLVGAGIIYQRNRQWYLSEHFEDYLDISSKLYKNWKKTERK